MERGRQNVRSEDTLPVATCSSNRRYIVAIGGGVGGKQALLESAVACRHAHSSRHAHVADSPIRRRRFFSWGSFWAVGSWLGDVRPMLLVYTVAVAVFVVAVERTRGVAAGAVSGGLLASPSEAGPRCSLPLALAVTHSHPSRICTAPWRVSVASPR